MTARDANLQLLLDLSARAILARAGERGAAAAELVFSRLGARQGSLLGGEGERLAVCHAHLDGALNGMAAGASPLPELAAAFGAVEASLRWARRASAQPGDEPFYNGHANATLIGKGGLEQRDDVWVGATVMAPGVTYPDHSHPPEEVYLALTPGQWWNAEMDWSEPGPGGVIYNPPGILHAMRSGPAPFLALWFLPVD